MTSVAAKIEARQALRYDATWSKGVGFTCAEWLGGAYKPTLELLGAVEVFHLAAFTFGEQAAREAGLGPSCVVVWSESTRAA